MTGTAPAGGLLELQRSHGNRFVQRLVDGAESSPAAAPDEVYEALQSSGQPLDRQVRADFEPRFGRDLGDVRVHTGAQAARSALAVNAQAYTVGRDVVFGEGRYQPGSGEGRRLLAHELTHVVQQGGASGAVQGKLEVGAADSPAEHEADAVARAITEEAPAPEPQAEGAPAVRRQAASSPGLYVARDPPAFQTSQEKILAILIRKVPAGDTKAQEQQMEDLRKEFREARPVEVPILQKRLTAVNPKEDPLAISFQALAAERRQELLGLLGSQAAKPGDVPATQGGGNPSAATPPSTAPKNTATLSTDRTANQRAHLELVRGIQKEIVASFGLLDAELTATTAYGAFVQVRDNVMKDVESALTVAAQHLAGANAATQAPTIQTKLEQSQLWLFYVVPYAHLAALVRSAEHDRLVTDVIVAASAETINYAKAFTAIGLGTPAALTTARTSGGTILENTKKLFTTVKQAIAKGQESLKSMHVMQSIVDVPLEFAAGAILPPWALAANVAVDRGAFYLSHKPQFDVVAAQGPTIISELGWLEGNAPHTKKHILHPIYLGMARDSYAGISASDVAFIVGRTIYLLAKKKSPVTWKDIAAAATKATVIVTALHSPKLLVAGAAKLTEKTRESVLKAIGDEKDSSSVLADLNQQLGASLTRDEMADLVVELMTPPVEDHVKNLTTAIATVGPHIAAIVADAQGTGVASAATTSAATAINYPLLPAAP